MENVDPDREESLDVAGVPEPQAVVRARWWLAVASFTALGGIGASVLVGPGRGSGVDAGWLGLVTAVALGAVVVGIHRFGRAR